MYLTLASVILFLCRPKCICFSGQGHQPNEYVRMFLNLWLPCDFMLVSDWLFKGSLLGAALCTPVSFFIQSDTCQSVSRPWEHECLSNIRTQMEESDNIINKTGDNGGSERKCSHSFTKYFFHEAFGGGKKQIKEFGPDLKIKQVSMDRFMLH
ncbi:hypothetical protein XENOCAPTIV_022274 [Xenoophorus captivus]|uniref:Uncharacterized protein n=1 Tax=Xenoophorus captivus TaxID=1517983 RepID=A0ABV0QKP6_9TELE